MPQRRLLAVLAAVSFTARAEARGPLRPAFLAAEHVGTAHGKGKSTIVDQRYEGQHRARTGTWMWLGSKLVFRQPQMSQGVKGPSDSDGNSPAANVMKAITGHLDSIGKQNPVDDSVDESIENNVWESQSMSFDFPYLDDMMPTAPMDRVVPEPKSLFWDKTMGGMYKDAKYVPPFKFPDTFPVISGPNCTCIAPPTWDEKYAQYKCQCSDDVASAPGPAPSPGAPGPAVQKHWHFFKWEPIHGTDNYKLKPADMTYSSGDYWDPQVHDSGIIAPADMLPDSQLPNQAYGDKVFPLPTVAHEDRIAVRYTRYIDQVEHRSRECHEVGEVTERCTVQCKGGDDVVYHVGNTEIAAKVDRAEKSNVLFLKYTPKGADSAKSTAECKNSDGCTPFRPCKPPSGPCVEMKDKENEDAFGNLRMTAECPHWTQTCKVIEQHVVATYVKKADPLAESGYTTCRSGDAVVREFSGVR
eukprot:gnl/TRDRNA2_/TRDRNA2_175829_c0_seq1.p1 gnl/TRDRNA2_/TRDRNA2_175829_c0~~gnl/TRDRNA2_/TRDRNA2_175829_c0_seq1.p1  ORF type:complete len:470 (-),score=74.83 gnl/TRDRNA2_/TRDRNA2_175829_c0_seq1:111-1520(-)